MIGRVVLLQPQDLQLLLVAVPAEAVKERARRNIPDVHDSVKRACSDKARIRQDGHTRHTRVDIGIVVDQEHLQVMQVHAPYLRRLVVQAETMSMPSCEQASK